MDIHIGEKYPAPQLIRSGATFPANSGSYSGPTKPPVNVIKVRSASRNQITLSAAIFIVGLLSYTSDSYSYLVLITGLLIALNVILFVNCLLESFNTTMLGKALLVGAVGVFFWLDAVSLSSTSPAFAVPPSVPGFAGVFDVALLQEALADVAIFQTFLILGYSIKLRLPIVVKRFSGRADSRLVRSQLLIYAFAGCGLFTTALAYNFDVRRVWTALVASRTGADSAWQDPGLWNNLAAFGMFGASYLLIEAWTPSRRRKIWQAIVGLAACLPFVMGGTRHLVLFVLLPVLVAGITRLRRMTIGRILALFLAGVVVFAILQLQYAVRAQGWDSLSKKVHTKDLFTNSTAQFSALLFALHLVPAEHGFFYELAEPYFLIHWIPRAIWPDKPVMATWTFYNNAYTLGGRFNVTPSVIGQFYMNWGTPGVAVIGLWLGMLTRFADLLIRSIDVDKQRALVVLAGMLHAFVIVSFRYYHPLYFTYWAFGLVATILITDRPHSWRAIAKSLRVS